MKHAYKSFLLENESPVKVCGDDSLYALQNTSNNTVTLQGSNTATTWVNIIDIPANTTKHVQSAFAFLKANGELHINRTQGSLFNSSLVEAGVNILNNGTAVSSSNPLPVQNVSASPVDRSSTITAGGAAQVAMAALATRKAYFFQNISSESMWGSFTGTAAPSTVGSFEIVPKGVIRSTTTCETTALSIYGATTGQKYTAWEM